MSNIVFVSGHWPLETFFAQKTKMLLEEYCNIHKYGFYYNDIEIVETYKSSLHFIRCQALVKAKKLYPNADWFVWLDSDVVVNRSKKMERFESLIDLTDKNILYHTFHEAPWGCYPINTGVKIVNKNAIVHEEKMWSLRNTSPWNLFPYEQKTLYEYIFPKLNKNEYKIHDPYVLNCITSAYPTKIKSALFIHMCGMNVEERDKMITTYI